MQQLVQYIIVIVVVGVDVVIDQDCGGVVVVCDDVVLYVVFVVVDVVGMCGDFGYGIDDWFEQVGFVDVVYVLQYQCDLFDVYVGVDVVVGQWFEDLVVFFGGFFFVFVLYEYQVLDFEVVVFVDDGIVCGIEFGFVVVIDF